MRLGKVQASGYVADVTEEELAQEASAPREAPATASAEPAISEPERVSVTG